MKHNEQLRRLKYSQIYRGAWVIDDFGNQLGSLWRSDLDINSSTLKTNYIYDGVKATQLVQALKDNLKDGRTKFVLNVGRPKENGTMEIVRKKGVFSADVVEATHEDGHVRISLREVKPAV